jgi:hypothetical protein
VGRQIGCIVAIGLAGLFALAIMAGYGARKNPRLWLKARIEAALPVTLERFEPVPDEAPFRRGLRLSVRWRPEAARRPGLAEDVAIAAARAFRDPEAPALDFARITVEVEGEPPVELERYALERKAAARAAIERQRR